MNSSSRPTGAELERMAIVEGLFMKVVSIVIQNPLKLLYLVVKDESNSDLLISRRNS
jgi:hypothetical protein